MTTQSVIFIDWYCSEPRLAFNRTVVTRYCIALEQRPYAHQRLAYESADCGLLSPISPPASAVEGSRNVLVCVGNWLSADQRRLLLLASASSTSEHIEIMRPSQCSLAAVSGERRWVTLRIEDVQLREDDWVIADLIGERWPPPDCTHTRLGQGGD